MMSTKQAASKRLLTSLQKFLAAFTQIGLRILVKRSVNLYKAVKLKIRTLFVRKTIRTALSSAYPFYTETLLRKVQLLKSELSILRFKHLQGKRSFLIHKTKRCKRSMKGK